MAEQVLACTLIAPKTFCADSGSLPSNLDGAKAFLRGVEPVAAIRGELYHPRAWSAALPRQRAEHFLDDPEVHKLMATLVSCSLEGVEGR